MSEFVLTDDQLDELADRLAARLTPRLIAHDPPTQLVDAATLAQLLGVSRETVYEHAVELGARRVGNGQRPRLRFDVDQAVDAWRSQPVSKPSPEPTTTPRRRQRESNARTTTGTPMLPIKRAAP